MTDDIVTRLREYASVSVRIVANELNEAADEIERLRSLLDQFFSACKIDGFGHVYDVDFGDLTQAYKNSVEVLK